MIQINKTYVIANGVHKGRYVVPMFIEEGGSYCCRFTGRYATEKAVSTKDLITIAEHKKRQMNEQ